MIAEVDYSRIQTRLDQGWIDFVVKTPKEAFEIANQFVRDKKPAAIAFYGNIIDLLEFAVKAKIEIDLLSDQTSCHNAYEGGYCPAGISFEERTLLLQTNPETFKQKVDASLSRHYQAIKSLVERGTYFFDYGNSFMKAVFDSGIKEIWQRRKPRMVSSGHYVEDIMDHYFDYGYGPSRWAVLSEKKKILDATDQAAMQCIDSGRRFQDLDNYN